MIVNTAWLLEYLQPRCSHAELIDVLPRIGLEIEEQHALATELNSVRIGFVRHKEPLAGAPGMWVCRIELERGATTQVVCASEHEVREGWGVPVAPAGTVLPTGRAVKADQYHGVRSAGMICLDGEMGLLARGTGMQHFSDESMLGRSLPEVADVSECLLDLNVLPNRPDFLGVVGIAREVAAALQLQLQLPPCEIPAHPATAKPQVAVEIADPDLCSRYIGGVIRNVKVAPSPAWLKARLLIAGMRPINNVVDVTNYVMYEWGQPLHAFDFSTVRGQKIVVRRLRPGETLELLTGARITVRTGEPPFAPLVIADAERPVALAGIMGGSDTQTTDETTTVLLEAAHFDPVNIRRTVRQVDLKLESRGTASSYRFERGTDPNTGLTHASRRAIRLIAELGGGEVAGPIVDAYPAPRRPAVIKLAAARVSRTLGLPVDAASIRSCLQRLGMECGGSDEELVVNVPTWLVGVNDRIVLIEDVARILGYDKVPVASGESRPTPGRSAPADRLRQHISGQLVAGGFFECRNPPLEAPDLSAWLGTPDDALTLSNFETQDMSVLRRSLLPGLAATVQNNLRRGCTSVRFFEIDRAFAPGAPGANDLAAVSRWRVGVVAGGTWHKSNWRGGERTDFFTLKGVLEELLESVGLRDATLTAESCAPYVSGTAARIDAPGLPTIGHIGEIDPAVLAVDRLTFPLYAFEFDLDHLLGPFSALPMYRHLARQPAVTRDLAVVVALSRDYADIAAAIRTAAGPTLESLDLVDRYRGQQVKAGHHSLAFRLVFRDAERTLTAEEANGIVERILAALQQQFGAELRA
jgi:phenylalanyl-tRNA synthetase beta chain